MALKIKSEKIPAVIQAFSLFSPVFSPDLEETFEHSSIINPNIIVMTGKMSVSYLLPQRVT